MNYKKGFLLETLSFYFFPTIWQISVLFKTFIYNLLQIHCYQDGWLSDPKLPAEWLMKPRKDKGAEVTASYQYLSDKFQQFDSTKAVVRFMQTSPESFSQKDIDKLESKVSETQNSCFSKLYKS